MQLQHYIRKALACVPAQIIGEKSDGGRWQGQGQMSSDPPQFGLTPQLASMLLNQNSSSRTSVDTWNNGKAFMPAVDPHLLNDQLHQGNHGHQMTQLEIMQAVSQIGVDNIPADLLQQLRGSLGEGALNALGTYPQQLQSQIAGNLPLGTMPNPSMPTLSRLSLGSQDSGYSDALRCS